MRCGGGQGRGVWCGGEGWEVWNGRRGEERCGKDNSVIGCTHIAKVSEVLTVVKVPILKSLFTLQLPFGMDPDQLLIGDTSNRLP